MATVRNLELTVRNDSETLVPLVFENQIQSFIADDEISLYTMGITRLQVPINDLSILNINKNDENFYVKMHSPYNELLGNLVPEDGLYTVKYYLSDTDTIPINKPNLLVDLVNKAFYKCHAFIQKMYPFYNNYKISTISNQVFNSFADSVNEYSFDLSSIVDNLGKTSYIHLRIFNIRSEGIPNLGSTPNNHVNLYLENPSGLRVCLATNLQIPYDLNYEINFSEIYDDSYNLKTGFTLKANDPADFTNQKRFYAPLESLLTFQEHGSSGTWRLIVTGNLTDWAYLKFDSTLSVACPIYIANQTIIDYKAPNYSLDTTSGIFSLRVGSAFLKSGFMISMGSSLLDIFQLSSTNFNGSFINIPQTASIADNSLLITFQANDARMSFSSGIEQIYIESQGLQIERDSSGINDVSNSILMQFMVDSSDVNKFDKAVFSTVQKPFRLYDLIGNRFDRFRFTVYARYSDNTTKQIYLSKNQVAYLTCSFFRKDFR
jgi:hypothetical protein